jgi:hypothetical protein
VKTGRELIPIAHEHFRALGCERSRLPLPSEQQLEPAVCDVCSACCWIVAADGRECSECGSIYDRDGERQLAKE